jgi:hypothetical protein
MTNKELEKINVKIAKKMGWKRFRMERLPEPLMAEARMTGLAPGNMRNQFVPFFTNNLAYAMQLVDWASAHGYNFKLLKEVGWTFYNASFNCGSTTVYDNATLPSMAICMAFLKIK